MVIHQLNFISCFIIHGLFMILITFVGYPNQPQSFFLVASMVAFNTGLSLKRVAPTWPYVTNET